MYASEVMQGRLTRGTKVFLGGDNVFVKNLVIDKLLQTWGISRRIHVEKTSDLKVSCNYSIFGPERVVYILGNKLEPKTDLQYVVKLGNGKLSKKFKDLGFEEVMCSDFFPNQVEDFCKIRLSESDVSLPTEYAKFICVSCGYDLLAVNNVIKILSLFGNDYIKSLSYENFAVICGRLSTSDESTIINLFIEGNYAEFVTKISENVNFLSPVLWGLTFALFKVKESMQLTKKPTWYQSKLINCGKRLEHYGIERVIILTHNLASSFSMKPQQIMLAINRLVKEIQGELR
jgi:hypothetical protein